MATVLIIYYKQISEGFDDKERFAIMQKVGMELREIRASIRSQVLMVFFLPLLVAGCHPADIQNIGADELYKYTVVCGLYGSDVFGVCGDVCGYLCGDCAGVL